MTRFSFVNAVTVKNTTFRGNTVSILCIDDIRSNKLIISKRPSYCTIRCAADIAVTEILPALKDRMAKTIESVRSSFNTIRTGRANPTILDKVIVEYYGAETPLNQLASVSVSGSSTLAVEPYDKSCIGDIERALFESDIGLTPNNDGSVIRLAVPPLTQERRKELTKKAKSMAEEGRVALRNIRRDAIDKLKKLEKNSEIGKDESRDIQDEVQNATNEYVKKIEAALNDKEKDLMKV